MAKADKAEVQVEEHILTGPEILAAQDMKPVKVPVPEWHKGGVVFVRPLASWEAEQWEVEVAEAKEDKRYMPQWYRSKLALKGLCSPDGSPLLTNDQLKALSQKSCAPVSRIVMTILEISGMSGNAVEQAEKNSDNGHADSSGTNSVTASANPTSENSSGS